MWFEDEELASRAIEGGSGIVAHLLHGFGEDGMWYEGTTTISSRCGASCSPCGGLARRASTCWPTRGSPSDWPEALRAPAATALPDFTFPARKDSRFGVSLAQPMYLELWEIGLARVGGAEQQGELWSWLRRLYQSPAPKAQTFDSYLHEAGEPTPVTGAQAGPISPGGPCWRWFRRCRRKPRPGLPATSSSKARVLPCSGTEDRYASLEAGGYGGGHGHPDRLNLVVHADGEYWLPDFGTGSYVARDLFWYRSTLAHNAPRLDGVSQSPGDAVCDNFEESGDWTWVRGRYGDR